MAAPRIILLAPDPGVQSRVQLALGEHGLLVAAATEPAAAMRLAESEGAAAIVVDARGPEERSLAMSKARGDTPFFALIDPRDDDAARQLLACGVRDVVPSTLIDSLLPPRVCALVEAESSARATRRRGRRAGDLLVGRSPAMVTLGQRIDMIAKSDMGAAIFGETGTGKELVARTVHARSRRAAEPFVVANCTALPEALFENELFGHERGAFTGADTRRTGLLSEAEGGTLLLDEIGEISDAIQAKLLRLLQFREYKLVGGTKTLKANVRILTTTHRDLANMVDAGTFREDLFYRMNTLHVTLPPLRSRREDIPLLVDHFVALFNQQEQRSCPGFTTAAIRHMQDHHWPGNVRELESVVYRSLVMAGGSDRLDVDAVDLRPRSAASPPSIPASSHPGERAEHIDFNVPFRDLKASVVERFERAYLTGMLTRAEGNLSEVARLAQHERKSLWRMLRKYDIDPEQYRPTNSDGPAESQ